MTGVISSPRTGSGAGAGILLLAVCMAALMVVLEQRPEWRSALRPPPDVPVTLSGRHYRVPEARLEALADRSEARFADAREHSHALVEARVQNALDTLFADLSRRIPRYADWYYSLRGEYARLSMLVLEKAGLTDGGYQVHRLRELVFEDVGFDKRLGELQRQTRAALVAHAETTRQDWLADMVAALSGTAQPVPPLSTGNHLHLDRLVSDLSGLGDASFSSRLSASHAAGVGAGGGAGALVWRSARRGATASGRAVAARGAARGAARVGAAAGGGAAICAPTGPGAFGCAVVAGVASWLATDWLLLRVDEVLNREELVASLQSGLDTLRRELEQDLTETYRQVVDDQFDAVQADIRRTFVPSRLVRRE